MNITDHCASGSAWCSLALTKGPIFVCTSSVRPRCSSPVVTLTVRSLTNASVAEGLLSFLALAAVSSPPGSSDYASRSEAARANLPSMFADSSRRSPPWLCGASVTSFIPIFTVA